MKLKAAIFDMDGTLIDSLMFWDVLWQNVGVQFLNDPAFKPSAEVDKQVRTMLFCDAMEYVKTTYRLPVSAAELLAFGQAQLENFYRNVVKPKEGAHALLEHLKQSGVKLCLATATDMQYAKIGLESCGLAPYFDLTVSCADLGVGKDRPDIYLHALRLLEVDAKDACVFEDSYVALETARSCGLHTVGIYDRYNYGQDRLQAAAEIYVAEGVGLQSLIASLC